MLSFGILILVVHGATIVTAAEKTCKIEDSNEWAKPKDATTTELAKTGDDDSVNANRAELDWQSLLLPAPNVICLLGQIMVVASKRDFPLTTNHSVKYQFIKYPESLRATLTQLANLALEAFMLAHGNMGKISAYAETIPASVAEVMELIESAKPSVLKELLEVPTESIVDTAAKCVKLANETTLKFQLVMSLISEILEGSIHKKGADEGRLKETEAELSAGKEQEKRLQEQQKKYEKEIEEMQKKAKKSEAAYEKALNSLPGPWETFGQEIIKMAVTTVGQAVQAVASVVASGGPAGMAVGSATKALTQAIPGQPAQQTAGQQTSSQQTPRVDTSASDIANLLLDYSQRIEAFMNTFKKLVKQPSLDDKVGVNGSLLSAGSKIASEMSKTALLKISPIAGSPEFKTKASDLVNKGQKIFDDTTELCESAIDDLQAKLVAQQKLLDTLAQDIKSHVQQGLNVAADGKQGSTAATTPGEKLTNEQLKVQLSLKQLEIYEQKHEAAIAKKENQAKQLFELSQRLSSLDVEKSTIGEIIEILNACIKVLSDLKEDWIKLVQFFMKVSEKAEATLGVPVQKFVKYTQKIEKVAKNDPDKDVLEAILETSKHNMQCNEFAINKASKYLFIMASTYNVVSSRFILPSAAVLTRLIGEPDVGSRTTLLEDLRKNATVVTDEIKKISSDQAAAYKAWTEKGKEDLKKKMAAANKLQIADKSKEAKD